MSKKKLKKHKKHRQRNAEKRSSVNKVSTQAQSSHKYLRIIMFTSLPILFLGLGGVGIYFFNQYQKNQAILKNPVLAAEIQRDTTISSVSKLMELPKNEQPTIATVTDYTKVNNQQFFINAQNGDRVLIYTKAKEAILYRPSTNKIITVGPVNINQTTPAPTQAPLNPKIAIYNGTNITGLTKKIEQKLKGKLNNVSVITKTNASKFNYLQTLVIDLTSTQSAATKQIAQILNGQITTLPVDEIKPVNADILIIGGKNNK